MPTFFLIVREDIQVKGKGKAIRYFKSIFFIFLGFSDASALSFK